MSEYEILTMYHQNVKCQQCQMSAIPNVNNFKCQEFQMSRMSKVKNVKCQQCQMSKMSTITNLPRYVEICPDQSRFYEICLIMSQCQPNCQNVNQIVKMSIKLSK